MENLKKPFNVLKKHLLKHHNLNLYCDLGLYEQEKDVFCFGHCFHDEKKSIFGQIDVHQKEIVYEISDFEYTKGEGFYAYSPIESKLETITY